MNHAGCSLRVWEKVLFLGHVVMSSIIEYFFAKASFSTLIACNLVHYKDDAFPKSIIKHHKAS